MAIAVALLMSVAACGGARGPTARVGKDATLSLARACVAPGGNQALEVHAPRTVVVFTATYADGQPGSVHGGAGSQILRDTPEAKMSWRVAPDAPSGPAVVEVGILDSAGEKRAELDFRVSGPKEPC